VTIEFDTAEFFRSHMRNPKGWGSWAFFIESASGQRKRDPVFAPPSSYADAKAWVKAHIRAEYPSHSYICAVVAP
jgi:hypothetical protein